MRVLTFDIEDWFHLLDHPDTAQPSSWKSFEPRLVENLHRILALLERTNAQATFFCLGWVAEQYPELVTAIVEAGHEIGCHSYYHQLAYELTYEEFFEDTCRAKTILEEVSGKRVVAYRIPGFSLKDENQWVFEALINAGFEYDCSVFSAARSHGGISSLKMSSPGMIALPDGRTIREFPLNTVSIFGVPMVFSGGGYFRLAPSSMLSRLFGNDRDYVMTYFHPRDFDPGQPVLPNLSPIRRFKSYVGLSSAEMKLERLLQQYDFHDLSSAAEQISWESVPVHTVRW